MLRRSILEISSRRALRRIQRRTATQIPPAFLSSRKEFSTVSKQKASPQHGSAGKPPQSGSSLPKFIVGGVAVGAAFLAAYQAGYLDQIIGKQKHSNLKEANIGVENRDAIDIQHLGEQLVSHESEKPKKLSPAVEQAEQKVESHSDIHHPEALSEIQGENQPQTQDKFDITPEEATIPVQEKDLPDDQSTDSGISSEGTLDTESIDTNTSKEPKEGTQIAPLFTQDSTVLGENDIKTVPPRHLSTENILEDASSKGTESPSSLLEAYQLRDGIDHSIATSLNSQGTHEEALISAIEELNDAYISKDGKLVLDFLQAIHAAEKRQAELDARVLAEEKRALKEKYEKELKDAGARELMRVEEVAMLDKELKRERAKAALALKSLQEKLEEKLKMELEQKESEAELRLNKVQEYAKAELAASIASEKAAQIEKMAEANLHINALCMAFYARSEEARQSHSAHKLALGALALEDALLNGLPIQTEIEALHSDLEGIDKDSIIDLVLLSLPEETRNKGTDTLLQLNHKFDGLKGTLQHFSLIPPGGGGILAHSLAHIASWLKVKEVDQYGDGIESVINKVECYLAEGKLAEAADALEEGVKGTQAAEIVGDWVRQVRNRAIAEQALTLLQSYATAISLT